MNIHKYDVGNTKHQAMGIRPLGSSKMASWEIPELNGHVSSKNIELYKWGNFPARHVCLPEGISKIWAYQWDISCELNWDLYNEYNGIQWGYNRSLGPLPRKWWFKERNGILTYATGGIMVVWWWYNRIGTAIWITTTSDWNDWEWFGDPRHPRWPHF